MTNTWHLYYTTNPCGSGHNSVLSYIKNADTLIPISYGTMMVPCGVDYGSYVIENFINNMIQYYGLLDVDIIYINDVLYTKRWTCNASTGICSQIGSGSGYASEAECRSIFPCNPNQWKINTPTLTGTVSVSGIFLAWSLTPKNGATVNFNFGNSILYDGIGMTPVIYTDSAGITQIGVYKSGSFAGNSYAMNTSYHGGNADFYLHDSDVNIISKTFGYAWEIQYPKGAGGGGGCVSTGFVCEAGKPGYAKDNCGTEKVDSTCVSGNGPCGFPICYNCNNGSCGIDPTGPFPTGACGTGCGGGSGGGSTNWFSRKTFCITPTTCIPNWGLVGIGGILAYMIFKK